MAENKPKSGGRNVILRFIVSSDIHISEANDRQCERYEHMMQAAYCYAHSQPHNTLDAAVLVGDLTNRGQADQYEAVKELVNHTTLPETEMIIVHGNHDCYETNDDSVYREHFDSEVNKHVVVNGYHFVGIAPDIHDEKYSPDVLDWLSREVEKAAEDGPDKPIFTFQHQHLRHTVYTSESWYTGQTQTFMEIFSRYPQVINFSGHSHAPVNIPTSVWQEGFTAIGTGTLHYLEMEEDTSDDTVPKFANDYPQFWIVEVDEDNRVTASPFDLDTDDFFKKPFSDENYVIGIDTPAGADAFRYTAKRFDENTAEPVFPDNAAITFEDPTDTAVTAKAPQAYDRDYVYRYEIVFDDGSDGKKIVTYYGEYYMDPVPPVTYFRAEGLTPDTAYRVSLTPENVWGRRGRTLHAEFTTLPVSDGQSDGGKDA